MKTRRNLWNLTGLLILGLAFLLLADAVARDAPPDTTLVLGGPGRWDGSFEDAAGQPNWHGWTHADLYGYYQENHWHVSDHLPLAGEYSLWCGTWFDNYCADGYGNGWRQTASYLRAAVDPATATTVRWQATARVDSEPGYDYFHVQVRRGTVYVDLMERVDGMQDLALDFTVTFEPADYYQGEWELRFLVQSDEGWSDEDCQFNSHGFARVDDITVTVEDQVVSHEDFESGATDHWLAESLPVVGDFTQLWSGLDDDDPLHQNDSWQVAFVDDGLVVPGTGGTPCGQWCYGPDGWVLNPTAGLDGHGVSGGPLGLANGGVWNAIMSPVLAWPAGADNGELAFDVYAHMFTFGCGMTTYGWTARATAAADPAELDLADWAPTRWSWLNEIDMPAGPGYFRIAALLESLLPADTRWVQVRIEVHEAGPWCWGEYVDDPSPAPYFDNVAVRAWKSVSGLPEMPASAWLVAEPNPFNPRVKVRWSQPAAGPVDLTIFDARGRRVRGLWHGMASAGAGEALWDGCDDAGRQLAGGLYIARLETAAGTRLLKLTLLK